MAKNKITWQVDQTNISIWKQDREQTLSLWSVLAFSLNRAINSNSIVWGFPIFSLAALSNKLISCGELRIFFVCHVFPPFQTHKYSPYSPRGINQRQPCQVLCSCMCISFFFTYLKMVYFCFSSINALARLLLHQAPADSWKATWFTDKSLTQNTKKCLSPTLSLILLF